jgi:two-component system sensor histidine kinase/response regulator
LDHCKHPIPASSGACCTIGDDIHIAQVVRNILSNAIKFTPEGGAIRLRAEWIKPNIATNDTKPSKKKFTLKRGQELTATACGALNIGAVDSGAGMTQDQVATVFDDGVQFNTNELQKGNGTGLGLHIAKGIMELHGGGDLITSSEGLGKDTTFLMMVPLFHLPNPEHSGIPEEQPSAADLALVEVETGPLRILVEDDAAMNCKLLMRLLQNHGGECVGADDGNVAVEEIRKSLADRNQFDITVLLDHKMPRLSGPDAAQQMHAIGSDVFIVVVTGNLLPNNVEFFKQCGANAVLQKAFKLQALEQLWIEYDVQQQVRDDEGGAAPQ